MINSLKITSLAAKTIVPWWGKTRWHARQNSRHLKFGTGLNLIVGENGSGKSALVRLLGDLMFAHTGGRTTVTHEYLAAAKNWDLEGLELDHVSTGCWVFDAEHTPGLIGGMAAFDDDFLDLAMTGIQSKNMSGGQGISHRLIRYAKAIKEREPAGIAYNVDRDSVPERVQNHLNGTGVGMPTFILDEPDRNLDLLMQMNLWNWLSQQKDVQIIVVTHSIVALNVEGRILTPSKLWLDKALDCARGLGLSAKWEYQKVLPCSDSARRSRSRQRTLRSPSTRQSRCATAAASKEYPPTDVGRPGSASRHSAGATSSSTQVRSSFAAPPVSEATP
jgi:predicted ATPase